MILWCQFQHFSCSKLHVIICTCDSNFYMNFDNNYFNCTLKLKCCTFFSDGFALQFQVEVLIDCNFFPIQDYIGSLLVFISAIASLATCLTGQTSPAYVGLSITYALQVQHSLIDKECCCKHGNFHVGINTPRERTCVNSQLKINLCTYRFLIKHSYLIETRFAYCFLLVMV